MPLPAPRNGTLPPPRSGRIDLQLPANALLHVNGEKVDLAARYVTPDLEPGQDYYYDIDVSFVRDGKAFNRVKRVTIRAGDVLRLTAEDMDPPQWTALPVKSEATASLAGRPSPRATLAP
jgi:uncharacterized protein (TIGR03000 family)